MENLQRTFILLGMLIPALFKILLDASLAANKTSPYFTTICNHKHSTKLHRSLGKEKIDKQNDVQYKVPHPHSQSSCPS